MAVAKATRVVRLPAAIKSFISTTEHLHDQAAQLASGPAPAGITRTVSLTHTQRL
jgi:hypothetical protein